MTKAHTPPRERPLLALAIRVAAMFFLSVMVVGVRLASESGIHLAEILFWRQFVTLPLLVAWLAIAGSLATLGTDRPGTHAVRAILGLIGMGLNFGAVILLPLAEATVISYTSTIFAVILAVIFLKEAVGIYRVAAVVIGLTGVIVIAQPGDSHLPLFGALVGLGGAFFIALISIHVKDLNRTDLPVTIVFYFALTSSVVLGLALPFVHTAHDTREWLLLLGLGVAGTIGQLLLTAALRFGAVASVIVMDYTSLVWATGFGWFIWAELPPATTWIGAPMIVIAGLIIAWREHFLARRSAFEAAES